MKNKMKEKENEDLNLALPHDLIVEILLRLPVRSLVRFKCVCTSWRSLIFNPHFAKSHFDLAASPTHRLLLNRINDGYEIESFDLEASLNDPFAVVNLKFPPYRAPSLLTLGSCRGFILLAKTTGPSAGDHNLWNPSTGDHRDIPITYADWNSWYNQDVTSMSTLFGFLYGFGYDESKDDYLLVLIQLGRHGPRVIEYNGLIVCMTYGGPEVTTFSRPRIEVLSVKTNVPSFIYGEELEYVDLGPESVSGLFLNQSLHWLVISKATRLHVIIAFDLVERSLSEIPLTPDLPQELATFENCHLRVLGGCLGLCYSGGGDDHGMTEIWVMEEYKVQSSWTRSFVLPESDFLPICLTEGGGVLGADSSGTFEKFDDKGEWLEDNPYVQENKRAFKYFDMYRESLLALPNELYDLEEAHEDNCQYLETRKNQHC